MKNNIVYKLSDTKILDERTLKNLNKVFNDKAGIVNALLERNELRKYGFHMYQTLSAESVVLFGNDREVSSGGLGVNRDKKHALEASFYEAIERYCMSCTDTKQLVRSKYCDLEEGLKPCNFVPYTSKQYKDNPKFVNPTKRETYWVKLRSCTEKGGGVYWPASLVYLPFIPNDLVAETSSTGVAAGTSIEKSIMNGLLELIERDAIMINFGLNIKKKDISLNTFESHWSGKLIQKLLKQGFHIKVYKLYSDINIPIYMTYIWKGKEDRFHFGVGCCANLSSETAIEKAIKESLFSFYYSKNIMDLRKKDKKSIRTLYEHFLYYQKWELFQKLISGTSKNEIYFKEKISKSDLLQNIKKNGQEVYFYNLTTPDVNSFCKVVKVVVPGLIDLNKSHRLPRLGEKRYRYIKNILKIPGKFRLSNYPHPFP